MKVLESQSGLLSNHEVLALIRSSSDTQPQAKTHRKKKTKEFEDLNTIDYTVAEYLGKTVAASQSSDSLSALLKDLSEDPHISQIGLTKAERLMLVNLRPSKVIELYMIIEEAEDRASDEILQRILEILEKHHPLPPPDDVDSMDEDMADAAELETEKKK